MTSLTPRAAADNSVYAATILDQTLVDGTRRGTCVILTVSIAGQLRDHRNPAAGTIASQPEEREIWISLPDDDDERLAWGLRDLERLGFDGNDIGRLHPDDPDAVLFKGKQIFVRKRVVGGREFVNLYWPRQRADLGTIKSRSEPLNAKITALRAKQASAKGRTIPPAGGCP